MNLKQLFIFILVIFPAIIFAQKKDTIAFIVSKEENAKEINSVYEIIIKNYSDNPICILYSTHINLFYDPPQKLALFRNDKPVELYNLQYTVRDTLNEYENSNDNYDGEIILPSQEVKFRILIPRSDKEKHLMFEYISLHDFCYMSFEQEIFENPTKWHRKYRKLEREIKLPY